MKVMIKIKLPLPEIELQSFWLSLVRQITNRADLHVCCVSAQALHNRHQRCSTRHHGTPGGGATDHEATEAEVSRTPEDSVCSIEGPSAIYNDGPSTFSEVGFGTPNVSYRMSHKQ